MSVKIRLSRIGKKNSPIYRIVALDSRKKRDGACIENLGTYNPINHKFEQFHIERINYWISQGAVVSDAVKKLQKNHQKLASVAK